MSYPFLSDIVRALTGLDLPLPLPSFGMMVAIGLLIGIKIGTAEVQRLHEAGRLGMARRRASKQDAAKAGDPSLVGKMIEVPPQDVCTDLGMIIALTGIAGARLFHILEYPEQFMADPWGMLFSRGGLTIYGGMIVGTIAGAWYTKNKGLSIRAMADAIAPTAMIGYGIGRIGCQLAGDGDWGIPANMALKPDWLPTWFWAQRYEGNILGVDIPAPGVYPTPIYETMVALILFCVLWAARKHPFRSGWLFSLYLVLNGTARFFVEKIRVNAEYHFLGIHATQAEIIAVALILVGGAGLVYFSRARPSADSSEKAQSGKKAKASSPSV